MQYFDTHSHIDVNDMEPVRRAQEAGLAGLIAVGGSPELNIGAKTAATRFPKFAHLALGWDRSMTDLAPDVAAERLLEEYHHYKLTDTPLCAIGETGLDYFYNKDTVDKQKALITGSSTAVMPRQMSLRFSRMQEAPRSKRRND